MGLPRIIFNGKNIDFTTKATEMAVVPMRARTRNMSASGHPETLNIASGFSVTAAFRSYSNLDATEIDLKTALYEVAQWAEAGLTWIFARDRDLVVNTVTDESVTNGDVGVPVASASGVVSGNRYALECETEVAVVEASNSATDPVSLTAGLNVYFPLGSRFRDFEYLPMLGVITIIERPPLWYDVEISGTVDRRAL